MADDLVMVSLMAPIAAGLYRSMAWWLTHKLGRRVRFYEQGGWEHRMEMFNRGEVDLAFLCGLQYVIKNDNRVCELHPISAPVMEHPRYAGRPVYFSDVVVRADSPYRVFEDLRGGSWAYNEGTSHSGYNVTRAHLARLGHKFAFFSRVVKGSAHQNSLRLVLARMVDASAIDSTVLEEELRRDRGLAEQIRVIETFGPSPAPPGVCSARVPVEVRHQLRDALAVMHEDPEGRAILEKSHVAKMAPVSDADYHPIREMALAADTVVLSEETATVGPVLAALRVI